MSEPDADVDVLVIGAGMAGLAAAGAAADHGLRVGLVDRAPRPGGSALLSGGMCWIPRDVEVALSVNKLGDRARTEALVTDYADAVEMLGRWGSSVGEPTPMLVNTFDSFARLIDVDDLTRRVPRRLDATGGWFIGGVEVRELRHGPDGVRGAVMIQDGDIFEVEARAVILATGGYQNDAGLRQRFLGEHGAEMIVRSNPFSDGAGLKLGTSVGGAMTEHMDGFYGHLVPYPLPGGLLPSGFLRYAQLYSGRSVLLDERGQRFVDESIAYHHNARAVAKLPRALLVGDDEVLELDKGGYGGVTEQLDRVAEARDAGANVVTAGTLAELAEVVATWGYLDVDRAIDAFNQSVVETDAGHVPPRSANRRALTKPPFFALEVQPAITFTFGGLQVNVAGQVLDDEGWPVAGLFASGADAGGPYRESYLGGLSKALTEGRRAGIAAAASLAV